MNCNCIGNLATLTTFCWLLQTENHAYQGHSSHVTHVEFFAEDDRLLSTGGRDMAVLQWAVE